MASDTSGPDLRDYFAGKAMAAYITSATIGHEAANDPDKCARWAYEQADAMLKASGRPAGSAASQE